MATGTVTEYPTIVRAVDNYYWNPYSGGGGLGSWTPPEEIPESLITTEDSTGWGDRTGVLASVASAASGQAIDLDTLGFSLSTKSITDLSIRLIGYAYWAKANPEPDACKLGIQLLTEDGVIGDRVDLEVDVNFWNVADKEDDPDYPATFWVSYFDITLTNLSDFGAALTGLLLDKARFGVRLTTEEGPSSAYVSYLLDVFAVTVTYTDLGTDYTAVGCVLFGDDWDSPENILADDGDEARAEEALLPLVATCFGSTLKGLIPEGATCKGLWVRVKGTVYWETEPDALDLIVRFKDNEGYIGKASIAGKGTYWCPTCGWMWGRSPGATCPQCGEDIESHPLWETGEGSEQTFVYIFGGTDFAAVSAGAGAYILPPNCCALTDAGFGVEFEVRSSDTVGIDMPVVGEGPEVDTTTLTIGIDYVSVVVFYEE